MRLDKSQLDLILAHTRWVLPNEHVIQASVVRHEAQMHRVRVDILDASMRIAILKVIEEPRPFTVDLVVLRSTEAPMGLVGELNGVWFVMLVTIYLKAPRNILMTGLIQVLA